MCNERRIGSVESEVLLCRAVNFNSYSSDCKQELFKIPVSQASNLPYIQLQPRIAPKSYFFRRVLFLTLCQISLESLQPGRRVDSEQLCLSSGLK